MKIYTSRPTRGNTAKLAWDYLSNVQGKQPVSMWRAHLTYWCWVMKYSDGDHEDVDCLTILSILRNRPTLPM